MNEKVSGVSEKTTNLIERSFEEERRRTKVLPRFCTEHSALKLVFGALYRATQSHGKPITIHDPWTLTSKP